MRRAPSNRITSPFSKGFSTIHCTRWANSPGCPRRLGFGTVLARNVLTFSGRLAKSGVSNRPGGKKGLKLLHYICISTCRSIIMEEKKGLKWLHYIYVYQPWIIIIILNLKQIPQPIIFRYLKQIGLLSCKSTGSPVSHLQIIKGNWPS